MKTLKYLFAVLLFAVAASCDPPTGFAQGTNILNEAPASNDYIMVWDTSDPTPNSPTGRSKWCSPTNVFSFIPSTLRVTRLGVGDTAPTYTLDVQLTGTAPLLQRNVLNYTGTSTVSGAVYGAVFVAPTAANNGTINGGTLYVQCSDTDFTGTLYGVNASVANLNTSGTISVVEGTDTLASCTGNGGTTTNARGVNAYVNAGAGHTITTAKGIRSRVLGAGTKGDMYGVHVETMTGPATNSYGIRLAAATGVTDDWGVYSEAAKNRFTGQIQVGTSNPTIDAAITETLTDPAQVGLGIKLANAQTAEAISVTDNADAVVFSVDATGSIRTGGTLRFQADNTYNIGTLGARPANVLVGDQVIAGGTISGENLTVGGGGTTIDGIFSATGVLDFASTAAGAVADLTITVTGAALGDTVDLGVPHASTTATSVFTGWVSAANTVTVRFAHTHLTNAEDPASGTFRATVTKF